MSDASDEMVFGLDYRAQILALGLTPEELAERTMQTVEWARAFLCVPNAADVVTAPQTPQQLGR